MDESVIVLGWGRWWGHKIGYERERGHWLRQTGRKRSQPRRAQALGLSKRWRCIHYCQEYQGGAWYIVFFFLYSLIRRFTAAAWHIRFLVIITPPALTGYLRHVHAIRRLRITADCQTIGRGEVHLHSQKWGTICRWKCIQRLPPSNTAGYAVGLATRDAILRKCIRQLKAEPKPPLAKGSSLYTSLFH